MSLIHWFNSLLQLSQQIESRSISAINDTTNQQPEIKSNEFDSLNARKGEEFAMAHVSDWWTVMKQSLRYPNDYVEFCVEISELFCTSHAWGAPIADAL